uniref:alpha/beta hydrolase family protein n=1 Tax=Ningiella ruwaisensis TaxID=2364274 RepID=UPI001F4F5B8A|nr:S9 family peptidase [Ningiella ruwaisensis]
MLTIKKIVIAISIWLFAMGSALAETKVNTEVLEAFAKQAQYLDIQISPEGKYIASTSRAEDGKVFVTVLDIKEQKVTALIRGSGNQSVGSVTWLNDERLLLTMVREIGSLEAPVPTGELLAIDADGSNQAILTGFRSETGDKRFSFVVDTLPLEPDVILVGSSSPNSENPFLDIDRMKISNGRRASAGRIPLRAYEGATPAVITDNNGNVLVAIAEDPNKDNAMVMMTRTSKDAEWEDFAEYPNYEPSFRPFGFLPDNLTLVGVSTLETDTWSLATLNIKTKKHEVLASHPKVDIQPIIGEQNGLFTEVFGVGYEYEEIGAMFFDGIKDVKTASVIASLFNTFKGQAISLASSTADNSKLVLSVGNANHPQKFYLYDSEANGLIELAQSRPWLDDVEIPESKLITYKARDGLEISAVLTLPPGKEAKDLPFILLPHGGPHGPYDTISRMDTDAKVFASHGYAVLQPNFRGSGGYGLPFEKMGFRNWGTTMINDMTDGTMHLVEQGIVDKDRMCVYGGSYGGYAALQSVVREPDLYQCTVGFVGVYDLDMMEELGDIPERQAGLNYLAKVLPQGKDRDFQSPIKNVDKIKVPVFIIQGEEDRRVPKEQAFALRDELEKHNKPYQWMMKSGEGHGFYKPENNIERWTEMLKFFNQHTSKS